MILICLTSANGSGGEPDSSQLDHWLLGIAGKDSQALADLYDCTSASVYAFALSVLKNTQDAEDILHDCYLRIWSAAPGYHSSGKPMAWILTITRNLCLLKIRERSRISDIPSEDWESYLHVCENASPEDKLMITECMKLLSDQERQILVLHAVAGFKHRETAKLLALPLPTVLSKYNRALKKLKNHMEKEYER